MNRTTIVLTGFLLAIAPLAMPQEPQPAPSPSPEDAFGTQQLVAWSRLQKPQPSPQPLPPRDTPIPPPDPSQDQPQGQSQDQQSKEPANPQQMASTQSFTGKIIKDGGKYVLKVASNSTYQLNEQSDVRRYENQDVKVIGNLDTTTNTIRVVKIELLS